jgi:peptidoglycan hydrolase-like protein with peptidoglycan-binding domain
MTKILFTVILFGSALVGAESHSLASTPVEPIIAEEGQSKDVSYDPMPFHLKVSMTQMALGTFGIGSGPFDGVLTPETQHAIQAYQKIRGLSPTEGIDLITFKTLMDDFEEWRRPSLFPSSMVIAFSEWEKGYISVSGTWMSEEAAEWNLNQVTSLFCWRDWKLCVEATAESGNNARSIGVSQRTYVIDDWNETEIVTAKERDKCPVSTVHIVRSTQAVTGARFPDEVPQACEQSSPLMLKLVDGYMLYTQVELARLSRFKPIIQAPGFALPKPRQNEGRR